MRDVALALVHHPVLGRDRTVVTSAITNLDVHDIARSARTYDVRAFYVTHPIEAQRTLVERIRAHWTDGPGARRIPDRKPAMDLVRIVSSLDDAIRDLGTPEVWTTAASPGPRSISFSQAKKALDREGPPVLVVFGTSWGLAPEVHERAAARLAPIAGRGEFNHLSVRAACAIILDRLLGDGA